MKIRTQAFENGQAVLHIEVEPPEMEKSMDEAYHELAKKMRIPGFRKGKIPRPILESYVGRDGLKKEALEHLVPELCNQAAEEQKLEAIAPPQVEILEMEPVVFKATFPLRPKVEIGDYRSIRLDPEPVEIGEEEVSKTTENLREQHATWVPVERPIGFGDMAVINIEQSVEPGPPVNYGSQQLPVIQGSPLPLPGFAEQIVGMEKNQEKEFSISFPDNYEVAKLAGQKYSFRVKLTEVKEKNLPELNDEFAKSVDPNVETLEALRNTLAIRLRSAAEERATRLFEQKVVQAAVASAKVEYPPILVESEIDRLVSERDRFLRAQGSGPETYLKMINKTEEQMREELRPTATERLVQSLVLGKISEEEKMEVSAADIDAELEKMTKDDEKTKDIQSLFGTPQGRRWISDRLLTQKTIQRLTEIANGKAANEEEIASKAEDSAATKSGEIKGEAEERGGTS